VGVVVLVEKVKIMLPRSQVELGGKEEEGNRRGRRGGGGFPPPMVLWSEEFSEKRVWKFSEKLRAFVL
jgi:hypothetical protein